MLDGRPAEVFAHEHDLKAWGVGLPQMAELAQALSDRRGRAYTFTTLSAAWRAAPELATGRSRIFARLQRAATPVQRRCMQRLCTMGAWNRRSPSTACTTSTTTAQPALRGVTFAVRPGEFVVSPAPTAPERRPWRSISTDFSSRPRAGLLSRARTRLRCGCRSWRGGSATSFRIRITRSCTHRGRGARFRPAAAGPGGGGDRAGSAALVLMDWTAVRNCPRQPERGPAPTGDAGRGDGHRSGRAGVGRADGRAGLAEPAGAHRSPAVVQRAGRYGDPDLTMSARHRRGRTPSHRASQRAGHLRWRPVRHPVRAARCPARAPGGPARRAAGAATGAIRRAPDGVRWGRWSMSSASFGGYVRRNTWVYGLDPRVKLAFVCSRDSAWSCCGRAFWARWAAAARAWRCS